MERFNPVPLTAIEMAISDMTWEGGPSAPVVPVVKNSQFPERRDRIRQETGGVVTQAAVKLDQL